MADVVRSVERDLRGRLVEIERELAGFERLVAERSRIEAALARLDGQSDSAKRSRKSSGRRAPRGANRTRILAVVDERPGVSAAEVASATGIGSGTVGSTLAKLAEQGEVERAREDGRVTWRRVRRRLNTGPPAPV